MPAKRKLKNKLIALALIASGTILISSVLATLNPLERWQLKLTNGFYDRSTPSDDIVIVAIDDGSLKEETGLGKFSDWSRLHYREVIENLEAAGAKVIAFDIIFAQESHGISEDSLIEIVLSDPTTQEYIEQTTQFLGDPHPEDAAFAETLAQYDNLIFGKSGSYEQTPEGIRLTEIFDSLPLFQEHVDEALLYGKIDIDEVIRRMPYGVTDQDGVLHPTLSVKTYEAYTDASTLDNANSALDAQKPTPNLDSTLAQALDENGDFLIHYSGPPYHFPMISFIDAYNGFVTEAEVKDKIILVGITSEIEKDHALTPTDPQIPMPGVEIHANAIQTLIDGNFLHEQSVPSQVLTLSLLTLALTAGVLFLGWIPGLLLTIATTTGYGFSAKFIFNQGLILNLVYPILALLIAYLAASLYKSVTETRDKRLLKDAFGKYVNKELATQIMNNPDALQLGGEKRIITAFFSDIENFTNFSEKSTPEGLVSQLNEYFEVMAGIVLKNNGTLNKFEGDAIMAFWGAPLAEPNHAILATRTALECRIALKELHKRWTEAGKPLLEFRVGLASGEAIAGNVGSKDRFDYTVMGDIVNLGARLESANKRYGTRIMMSDATLGFTNDQFEVRRLDRLRVKGKDQPVDVYEVLGFKGQLSPEQQGFVNDFHQAIEYYRNGQFEEAQTRFEALASRHPHDGPTQTYLARCQTLRQNPPTAWDGTWTLEHK